MSSKSSAHPEIHGHTFFSRKTILISVIVVVAMFFITVSYYPLLFNSNNSSDLPVQLPATQVK